MSNVIVVYIIFSLVSEKVSSRCNIPLGMRDGRILDFQITASSAFLRHQPNQARPQGQGWCALLGDPSPYLQVDFISRLTVEGIQINTDGSFVSFLNGSTSNISFAVEFGTNVTKLHRLSKSFHMDPLLPETDMQTFMFKSSLQLRYLRIYTLNQIIDKSLIFLRLEIIGCGIPDPLGIDRECTSPRHWYATSNIFVPYPPQGSLSKESTNTSSACLSSCQNISQCYSVLQNNQTSECEMYSFSSAYSYKSFSVIDSEDEAFIGIYEYPDSNSVSFLSTITLPWENKTQTNPGILVSSGYPFYYQTAPSKWIVTFSKETYGNLLFSNMSLNVYMAPKGSDSHSLCEDKIHISTIRLAEIYYTRVISSSVNNQQYSFKSADNTIIIHFSTCAEMNRIKEQGKGFRLLAYASDTPTCTSWDVYCEKDARIVSPSFLGEFSNETHYSTWTILLDSIWKRILLKITDFNVGCKTGTEFTFLQFFPYYSSTHCNDNKPIYPFLILTEMQLSFSIELTATRDFVEGFKGNYWTVRNHDVDRLTTSFETVCSKELKKCFKIVFNFNFDHDISWNFFKSKVCEAQNMSLGTIHSKREEDFISFFLTTMAIRTAAEVDAKEIPAYIGLRRIKNEFMWNDGSPVTFTAWQTGQPLKSHERNCTILKVPADKFDSFWVSASCDKKETAYGICEYFLLAPDTGSGRKQNGMTQEVFGTMPGIEQSLFFPCGDDEMISILGQCDGIQDCVSGKDEEDCDYSSACTMNEYRCSDGACVDVSVLCDFVPDCIGGEDEEDCDVPECASTHFQCHSKLCIDRSLRCDGKSDCASGEDELQCNTCNNYTSFKCDDRLDSACIHLMYKCDGIPDCQSGDDEKNCDKPTTCQGWWHAGYRTNGIYDIGDGDDIECDFSEILTGKITAKYHNIGLISSAGSEDAWYLSYKYWRTNEKLSGECFHSIDQLCQPWIQELYNLDKNGSGGQNWRCRCLRMNYCLNFTDDRYIEDCDGRTVADSNSTLIFDPVWQYGTNLLPELSFRDGFRHPGSIRKAGIRIRVNPIVCYIEFIPPPPDIVCGNGITVSNETRCLYRISVFGTMIGCRSLAHLQNCESFSCPGGFFKCPESFCLENRFVCDEKKQCQGGEDEQNCGTPLQKCVSQYRCLHSNVCLSRKYLCDGTRQCPLGDDERFCNFRCPQNCICKGMAADCRLANVDRDNTTISSNTKLLDFSTNPVFFSFFIEYPKSMNYLSFLNMSACNATVLTNDTFRSMRNLLVLDLSYNNIRVFVSNLFVSQHRLRQLLLTGNTNIHAVEPMAFNGLSSLSHLEVSHAHIGHVYRDAFHSLSLKTLDITYNAIDQIDNLAFKECTVTNMYMTGSVIKSFDTGMFQDLNIAGTLVTDSYKFCCIKPYDLQETDCYPHKDEFSSCSDLMRNDILRLLLWAIGVSALLGNAACLLYRFVFDRERLKLAYGIFVSNLAIADFLMGIYLIIIAAADIVFRGTYVFHAESWKKSIWCNMAGVLSAMSSEASVLFICLITVDRILVVKYPFGQIRFTMMSSIVCSCISWFLVALLATLPIFISSYFKDSFYSKTGVCLALPLSRDRPPGWGYSISIFIGFNFVTFLFIAAGQWLIYRTIDSARSKMRSVSSARSNDLRVARNLLLVATTDLLCWFPVGILGILALTNHPIPGEVYAWIAVLVLPINSALNPFLYTLSAILGRRKFAPDKDEQARSTVVPIDVFDVWNSNIFIQPPHAEQLSPLTNGLKKKRFEPKKCLLTAVTVAKCLAMLHERDMCHSNLTIQDLYKKPSKKGSFAVVMSLTPSLVNKEVEKQEEIAKFGHIVDALLKSCIDDSDTPGTCATTSL